MSISYVNGSAINQDDDEIIQLLNPTVHTSDGAGKFYYDLYMKSTNAAVSGKWMQSNGSGGYIDITGTHGGVAYTEIAAPALGSIYKTGVEINNTNDGLIKADHTGTGEYLDYWYAIRGPGLPSSLQASGTSAGTFNREFFLKSDRSYTFTATGSFTWKYWDGDSWEAYTDGTSASFIGIPPASGKVQIACTGTTTWALKAQPKHN